MWPLPPPAAPPSVFKDCPLILTVLHNSLLGSLARNNLLPSPGALGLVASPWPRVPPCPSCTNTRPAPCCSACTCSQPALAARGFTLGWRGSLCHLLPLSTAPGSGGPGGWAEGTGRPRAFPGLPLPVPLPCVEDTAAFSVLISVR